MLGRQRKAKPWGLLVSQPNFLSKSWAVERTCFKTNKQTKWLAPEE